jgi:ankyrin repeat protein
MHDADYLASRLIARDPHLSRQECGAVLYASRFGATLTLVELLKHGADPNSTSERGISALMAAAFYDQISVMRVLLAQPRIDMGQRTPVHVNPEFFKSQGLEGSQPPLTIGGRTALAYATLAGSRNAMKLLSDRGAR